MNWSSLLDEYGRAMLEDFGENPDSLPTDRNAVTEALKDPDFMVKYAARRKLFEKNIGLLPAKAGP